MNKLGHSEHSLDTLLMCLYYLSFSVDGLHYVHFSDGIFLLGQYRDKWGQGSISQPQLTKMLTQRKRTRLTLMEGQGSCLLQGPCQFFRGALHRTPAQMHVSRQYFSEPSLVAAKLEAWETPGRPSGNVDTG